MPFRTFGALRHIAAQWSRSCFRKRGPCEISRPHAIIGLNRRVAASASSERIFLAYGNYHLDQGPVVNNSGDES